MNETQTHLSNYNQSHCQHFKIYLCELLLLYSQSLCEILNSAVYESQSTAGSAIRTTQVSHPIHIFNPPLQKKLLKSSPLTCILILNFLFQNSTVERISLFTYINNDDYFSVVKRIGHLQYINC